MASSQFSFQVRAKAPTSIPTNGDSAFCIVGYDRDEPHSYGFGCHRVQRRNMSVAPDSAFHITMSSEVNGANEDFTVTWTYEISVLTLSPQPCSFYLRY